MTNLRERLEALPEPDPAAVDRMWVRFLTTQAQEPRRRRQRWITRGALALAAAALVTLWATAPESPRSETLTAQVLPENHRWSDQIQLETLGAGVISGTSRNATIDWESGTVHVEVEPNANTDVTVVTKEARVKVVGTKFDVRRDALGSTIMVQRGQVDVHCGDGWQGKLGIGEEHTCLPTTASELLGRASALEAEGQTQAIGPTLDRGLALAEGPVRGELLARRMRLRAGKGDVDGALADATAYLASPSGRDTEILRFAGWLSLEYKGCAEARPWLDKLHAKGSAQDTVLLAECLAATDPERARQMLIMAMPTLDGEWSARAAADLANLRKVLP
ncbi:MAG: FecR domain-containing protein [Myxococcota bacterium]